nr:hypothetical protein [Tanacetum cinerariifolium]
MLNAKGFFFLKFDSRVGLQSVLEEGSWMIRNNPIILKEWAMNTSLLKEELNRVSVKATLKRLLEWSMNGNPPDKAATDPPTQTSSGNANKYDKSSGNSTNMDKAGMTIPKTTINAPNISNVGISKTSPITISNPFDALAHDTKEDQNDDIVDLGIMSQTNPVMHVQINVRASNNALFCSFMYADNYYIDRRALWLNLEMHFDLMRDKPWNLMGDFNAALNLEDHSSGGYEPNVAMRDFKECVNHMEVMDINCVGIHFTWNQKPKGSNGVLKKNDRIMGNLKFNDDYPAGWNLHVDGFNMYRVVKRLKGLKSPFRKLLNDQEAALDEECFLKQKSKVEWLNVGDSNTTYFHSIVKSKCARSHIEMVRDASNNFYEGNDVADAFVKRYESFLGSAGNVSLIDDHDLGDKAPGPDGFTVAFFKKAWDVVGTDITCVIRDSLRMAISRDGLMENGASSRGNPSSVSVIMDALEEFKIFSGLVPSIPKSTAFFCNVPNAIKAAILSYMSFAESTLPVRFLGFPLISSRLLYRDCNILVERLENKVNDWKNKFLSLAGRV